MEQYEEERIIIGIMWLVIFIVIVLSILVYFGKI